jgi:hypothetical protein
MAAPFDKSLAYIDWVIERHAEKLKRAGIPKGFLAPLFVFAMELQYQQDGQASEKVQYFLNLALSHDVDDFPDLEAAVEDMMRVADHEAYLDMDIQHLLKLKEKRNQKAQGNDASGTAAP